MTPTLGESAAASVSSRLTTRPEYSSVHNRLSPCPAQTGWFPSPGITSHPSGKVVDITRRTILGQEAVQTTGQKSRISAFRQSLRRLALLSVSQTGSSLLSILTLAAVLMMTLPAGLWFVEALAGLLLIRIWYFNTRGPAPILTRYRIRTRSQRLIVDEGKIAIVFLGVCFAMAWPIPIGVAFTFVATGMSLQFCLMGLSRLVIKRVANYDLANELSDIMKSKAIIIGTGEHAQKVADKICQSPQMDTQLVGFLDFERKGLWRYKDVPLLGHPNRLEEIVANSQVDAVFLAVDPADLPKSWKLMEAAEKMGVLVLAMPNFYQPSLARVQPGYISGMPAVAYRSEPESTLPLLLKKIIDRTGALVGLILSAPIMLMVALSIKLDSRGPILFRQTRLGLNGKPFSMYKFRTMDIDAEGKKEKLLGQNEMSGPVFKIRKDPRITRVGQFLRKFSLDELPQFFNVLKGEMSLVGPRPPLPQEVRQFEPWQHRKLSVTPGLTCLWQVNGRNEVDFEDWVKLDLQYIDNWSLWLDAKILFKTVPAVMKGSGR